MQTLWKTLFTFGSSLGSQNYLSVLIYHRVLEQRDPLRFETIDARQFADQMKWVKQHFNVLPLRQAVEMVRQQCLPKRALAITFDDGYVDNLTVAAPILRSLELPASFFISSGMMGADALWYDKVIDAVKHTTKKQVQIQDYSLDISTIDSKVDFLKHFENLYKALPLQHSDLLVAQVVEQLGEYHQAPLFMDEQQVCALADAGMEIGSHGRHHRILSALTAQQAREEITQSKIDLEAILQRPVTGFAYPNGKAPIDFTDAHSAMVSDAGYEYALATNYGCSCVQDDCYKIKRFTPWRLNRNSFLLSMFLNYWYYQEVI